MGIYFWDPRLSSVRVFYSGAPQAWETRTGPGRTSIKEEGRGASLRPQLTLLQTLLRNSTGTS